MRPSYEQITSHHPKLDRGATASQLGTLGGGNHFVEVCADDAPRVWVMLNCGLQGGGNRIGTHVIQLAMKDMAGQRGNLPDKDPAYLTQGAQHCQDDLFAVDGGQRHAHANRELMRAQILDAMSWHRALTGCEGDEVAVNFHHEYVE